MTGEVERHRNPYANDVYQEMMPTFVHGMRRNQCWLIMGVFFPRQNRTLLKQQNENLNIHRIFCLNRG